MTMRHDEERSSALWIAAWFAIMGALLLFGCMNECHAATKYVKASGGSTSYSAGSDSSTAITLATFNTNAVSGDVALLLGGNYGSQRIQPVANGLTYRGLSGNPNDVTLGQLAEDGSRADSLVTVKYVTLVGNFSLSSSGGLAKWVVVKCNVPSGTFVLGNVRDSKFDSLTVTYSGATGAFFDANAYGSDSTRATRRDTISNSSFLLTGAQAAASTAIHHFSGYDNLYDRCRFNTNTAAVAGGQARWVRMNYTMRGEMRDCYLFQHSNYTTDGDEAGVFTFKDGVKLFRMVRDTIIIRGNSHGSTMPWILFGQNESDGNPSFWMEGIGGNKFIDCYVRNMTDATWGIGWVYGGFDGDSVIGNTFVAKNGSIETYLTRGSSSAYDYVMGTDTYMEHNLFATFASGARSFYVNSGAAHQGLRMKANIFYAPSLTDADTSSYRPAHFGTASDWGSVAVGPVYSDSNLFYAPSVTTKRLLQWSGGSSAPGMAPWLTTRAPLTLDQNSRVAAATFVSSAIDSFDAHPLVGSAANVGPNNYVGPFPYNTPETDVTRPAGVTNLSHASASDSTTHLLWTSPADDSTTCTGTQRATAYDLRYSTSRLFQSNFNAAASAVVTWDGRSGYGGPAFAFIPSPCGSNEEIIVSGLAPGTKYYFALKSADEAGNWSALSNLDSVTTTGGDTQRPAPTTSLVATATSTTSIRLTWRSVGDDSLSGTPVSYTVKRSTSTITEGNFAAATTVTPPSAVAAGTIVTLDVTSLSAGTTYYFAIKTTDDASQVSAISNVAQCATMSAASGSSKAAKVTIMALGRR